MTYFLYGLFFLSCIVLIITVLLQPGKTDAGALFTSNISSNAFGSRGTATVLSKTTIIAATVFMLSALMLSMPALNGGVSVLSTNPDTSDSTPVVNTNANVETNQPGLNTNTAANQPANRTANTTKANTEKKADPKKETNTKK